MVMCSRLLRNVPMFQNRDENFINAVLLKLEYEVFLEGDAIIRQNVPGDRMFFIDHGQVLMETDSNERELCDGDFFGGEFDLLWLLNAWNSVQRFEKKSDFQQWYSGNLK